jgi:type IV pilus assembly protein PilC
MGLMAVILLTGRLWWRGGRRGVVEMLLRRSRLCASILDNMGLFRFTSAMETFLASGEMQDNAVTKSIEMTDCDTVEKKLENCLTDMSQGRSFAQAAYDQALFEPVYGRMLLAGERSGNMENILERLTRLLEENCGAQVDKLVGVVDPLLSGLLMVTVGLSLLSVMLPLIGIMNSIG